MVHVLVVAAVLAVFGLTALCVAVVQVERLWTLLALVAGFAFAVPATIGVLTDPVAPWSVLALSAASSAAVAFAIPGVFSSLRRSHRRPYSVRTRH
jgi:hypothetical protein